MTPGQVTAVANVVTTAVLLLGAMFAGLEVREARRIREAQFRPFVVVDFDVASRPPFIHLVISNLGPVMARDVSFVFDPELSTSFDDSPTEGAPPRFADVDLFRQGLSTLAPGKRISVLFDSWITRGERPDAYRVKVSYRGEGRRSYEEEIRLDLAPFRFLRRVGSRDLADIHRELKEIKEELSGWRAPGGGLRVKSPRDIRREWEEWKREQEERLQRTEGSERVTDEEEA